MLKVYNSLGREKQDFKPRREGFVGMYVCGPTVYGHSHIGHAKSYVSFDVIVRYLRYLGCRVRYVQNITDVGHLTDDSDFGEDKVGRKARELGIEPMEVAELYTRSYFEDMDALNVLRPDISPRATGHIPEQIELVKELLARGHAYEVNGNVYFDVASFPGYGKLSGRRLEEMMEGVRIEPSEEKRNPADFALWKRAEKGHLLRWRSPWGEGFPGWHLECSAMGLRYLGPTLDIHGGGIENIFPHHEDEIAQSEGATGEQFVRYWLHNNMVTVGGQKMGKSLGNFITLKDAFAGKPPLTGPVRPMVIRYFVLTCHYRSPLDFSAEALEAARKGLERIEQTVERVRERRRLQFGPELTAEGQAASEEAVRQAHRPEPSRGAGGELPGPVAELIEKTKADFLSQMDDDFNTAGALGHLSNFTREVNRLLDSAEHLDSAMLASLDELYGELGESILGILRDIGQPKAGTDRGIERQLVEALVEMRSRLREARQYKLSDEVRERLSALGIELKDGPEGTGWERK